MVTFTLCKLPKFQMQKNYKCQTDCHFSQLIEQSLLGFCGAGVGFLKKNLWKPLVSYIEYVLLV